MDLRLNATGNLVKSCLEGSGHNEEAKNEKTFLLTFGSGIKTQVWSLELSFL